MLIKVDDLKLQLGEVFGSEEDGLLQKRKGRSSILKTKSGRGEFAYYLKSASIYLLCYQGNAI